MELAFLCKQLASNGSEINGLEAGMTSQVSPWRHKTTTAYSSLLQTKGLKALGESISLFPSPKAVMPLNVSASLKGPRPCWTRKRESKQMLICRSRGTNCSLGWTRVCRWAGHRNDALWQEAMARPSVEAGRPERVHSLHMGEQFPPKWLLTNGRPNYRQDWWVCPECWIYLSAKLHTQELKLWDRSHLQ